MVNKIQICVMIIILSLMNLGGQCIGSEERINLSNKAYILTASSKSGEIQISFYDKTSDLEWSDQPYFYIADEYKEPNTISYRKIEAASVKKRGDRIIIKGNLGGLELTHILELPNDRPIMEERIILKNKTDSPITLTNFEAGFLRQVTDQTGNLLKEYADERLSTIPFLHDAKEQKGKDNIFSLSDILSDSKKKTKNVPRFGRIEGKYNISEGWGWNRGGHILGIFAFSQENMLYSVITPEATAGATSLRFGGACMIRDWGEPAALGRIDAGEEIDLGLVRYETFDGNYDSALYGFREMLDENGCHFPKGYNPPVHWEELYDNPEWLGVSTPGKPKESRFGFRKISYSKELMEEEAVKAREYSCQALYLDPGWDTKFGSFVWGDWLGTSGQFIKQMETEYGLKVSLHCPLASWMSMYIRNNQPADRASNEWPKASFRADAEGHIIENSVCLGSKQYLDLAEKRLLKLCKDGVVFLMFDGNIWNNGCWNEKHGHPVPYTKEDHIRANLDLCRRIHAKYPKVLIEMHDMLAGGSKMRLTPVYYKYGLAGSYDENWGFELMWNPMDDIKSGRAKALYYYNMGCNVPAYLHVDLRGDNEHNLVLWWYASTCRHLGIGGTHPDIITAWRQKEAMKKYRKLERFYKRGEFYGINEEIHLHVLPKENAIVVNVFNLSDERRTISGSIDVKRLGIDPERWYMTDGDREAGFSKGRLSIKYLMEPWSSKIVTIKGG